VTEFPKIHIYIEFHENLSSRSAGVPGGTRRRQKMDEGTDGTTHKSHTYDRNPYTDV